MVVRAISHVDADGADGHADPIRLVVDGDGAKVGVQFVFEHPLRADQLTVHHNTFRTRVLPTQQTQDHTALGHKMLTHHVFLHVGVNSTCPPVRHQVQNVTRFGVDVKADVHVASVQVDDEVGVVIH